jgi:glutamyl-tRNA reductase
MPPPIILCFGTSHQATPVAGLEEAAAGAAAVRQRFADAIRQQRAEALPIRELAVLSTCNRVELWTVCDVATLAATREFLAPAYASAHVPACEHAGEDAVRHLCRVAAGIGSMVVGEPEIAGQVRRAFQQVLGPAEGPSLLRLVASAALAAGRRARNETRISRGSASISSVAVSIAEAETGGLAGRRVLVIGAGGIGRRVAETLRGSGADIVLANRTVERARRLAARVGGTAVPLAALPRQLATTDVLLAATAARQPLVTADMVRRALQAREAGRTLLLIDIAVPRNIDPDVARLPGVRLLGIDDLGERVAACVEVRRAEIAAVEVIIDQEVDAWQQRVQERAATRLIAELRGRAEWIRRRETERLFADLAEVDAVVRDRIEHFSRSIVNHLLHEPTAKLRNGLGTEPGQRFARELFGLDQRSGELGRDA